MSGPAVLLLGFAVTGRPATGSALLASVTIAAAAGGPVFCALLDRSRRPDRVLAATLAAYALAIAAIAAVAGRLPMPVVVAIALVAGLFNPVGQIYTTAASMKIAGMAAGAALAGPLAGRSVTGCLLVATAIELCAAAAYLLAGSAGPDRARSARAA